MILDQERDEKTKEAIARLAVNENRARGACEPSFAFVTLMPLPKAMTQNRGGIHIPADQTNCVTGVIVSVGPDCKMDYEWGDLVYYQDYQLPTIQVTPELSISVCNETAILGKGGDVVHEMLLAKHPQNSTEGPSLPDGEAKGAKILSMNND